MLILILSFLITAGIIVYLVWNFREKSQTALIEMYFTAIDEMYKSSSELNNEIKTISLDMERCDSLSEKSKEVILSKMKEEYKEEILQDTANELKEKGYIKQGIFEEGILITITEKSVKTKKIVFDISKFRSGMAAVLWSNCVARYSGEKWTYIKGNSIQA